MRVKKNAYRILVGKPERKRPLRRSRHGRVDNIKIDVRMDGVVCIGLTWFRVKTSAGLLCT
jgi:hypothetical protein